MFKKIITLVGFTSALMIAGQASATVVTIAGNGTITTANCGALSNTINPQLSTNVLGAYNCGQTSFVAGTCATKGTRKPQQVNCQYNAEIAGDGGLVKDGFTDCPATNDAALLAQTAAGGTWPKTSAIESRLGYAGTSAGGQVAAYAMGLDCDAPSLEEILPDTDLAAGDTSVTAP